MCGRLTGPDAPSEGIAFMSFTSFNLHTDLLRGLGALGFTVPTPIQKEAIPPVSEGRDVLACAMTGSGKTAAFLLPILQRAIGGPRATRALVLAPTRELAAQIDEHRRGLARFTRVGGAAIYGGVSMGPQEAAFRRGVEVLIATPGRLLDHLQSPYARLDRIEVLVLDEADRMLDMGFLPDIKRIMKYLPARRQTLLFSATIPQAITTLARELLHNPVTINVDRPAAPAVGITHAAYPVAAELKLPLLVELLRQPGVQNAHAMGTRIPRRTLPGFNYEARASEGLEIPLGERIAVIRARKAEERARARAKAERRVVSSGGSGRAR